MHSHDRCTYIFHITLLFCVCFFPTAAAYNLHVGKNQERLLRRQQEQEVNQFIQQRISDTVETTDIDPFGDDQIVRVLLIGLDKRVGQTSAHCDAIQLFEINRQSNTVAITAVPRGTYSPLPSGTGTTSSDYYVSNACGKGGLEYGINQIEHILNQKADYVVFVGFSQALGAFHVLQLPTTETLQWLRHRRGYAIGEPQRAHNHSTFLKQLIIDYTPKKQTALDTSLQYVLYHIIDTDLSFNQVQQISQVLIDIEPSVHPERITLSMRPAYTVQDIAYDPKQLENYLHQMIDPIAARLSPEDFSQMTASEMQQHVIDIINTKKDDPIFVTWAFENALWYQIQDEQLRESAHYDVLNRYVSTMSDSLVQEQIIADYILEMEYTQQTSWADAGRQLLQELLSH